MATNTMAAADPLGRRLIVEGHYHITGGFISDEPPNDDEPSNAVEFVSCESTNDDEPSDLADVIDEDTGRGSLPPGCYHVNGLRHDYVEERGYLYEV